ncbi:MAG TPA: hypothetical protein VIR57_08380 [Chloroflexota bacterium]
MYLGSEGGDQITRHHLNFLNELRRSPDIAIHMLAILSEHTVEAEERNSPLQQGRKEQ